MECSKCGVDGKEKPLSDVLSQKQILKLCNSCLKGEEMVVLRRPTTFQLKESEKKQIIKKGNYNDFRNGFQKKDKTEETLKSMVDKNYENSVSNERKPRPDLEENFHWTIMRARRRKKITQEQLAKEISESEAAIRMAEKGILPEDDYRLVSKIESFLGIKIVKSKTLEKTPEKEAARIITFDESAVYNLTIDDLKRMKEEREKEIFEDSGEDKGFREDEPKTF